MEEQIIYGRNAVTEALRAGKCIDTVYIQKGSTGLGKLITLAKENGAVVKDVSADRLDEMSGGGKHGGVAAAAAAAEYASVEDILAVSENKGTPPFNCR